MSSWLFVINLPICFVIISPTCSPSSVAALTVGRAGSVDSLCAGVNHFDQVVEPEGRMFFYCVSDCVLV